MLKTLINMLKSVKRCFAFPGSAAYWERRYARQGNSGAGSYGRLAEFKAAVLNQFVKEKNIETVIEFGCGDGNQLSLAQYPHYIGVDVSPMAVSLCRERFATVEELEFLTLSDYLSKGNGQIAELGLSLDVIYHLVEDDVFEKYMATLFDASTRYVAVYSSNEDKSYQKGLHVRHRKFQDWIDKNRSEWKCILHIPNKYPYEEGNSDTSFADFFFYER